MKRIGIALLFGLTSSLALAEPVALLEAYKLQAQQDNPAFAGFSAERGKQLYFAEQQQDGKTMSCTSCHTRDPRQTGKTLAFRKIEPLAQSAKPKRFVDTRKVEKWFRRNCNDVFARECTAQEKGDFITWIVTQ